MTSFPTPKVMMIPKISQTYLIAGGTYPTLQHIRVSFATLEPAGQSARIHQFALVIKSLGQYLHCTNTLEPPEVTALPLIQDTLRASLVRLCPRRTRTLRARTRQWSPRMADSHRHGQPEVSKCTKLMQESKMESWTLWLRCTETTIDSKCPTKAVS